jgi:hypothetical protein
MTGDSPCNKEQLDAIFVAAVQYIDPIIADKSKKVPSLYRNKIGRGTFKWGQTYLQQNQTHYGAIPVQDSSASWAVTAPARAPGTLGQDDAGHDPCRYESPVIEDGFEEKSFRLWQTTRRTTDICLNDILQGRWSYEQVLALKFDMLAAVTVGEWEYIEENFYINFCNKFFAAPGTSGYGLLPFGVGDLIFGTGVIPIPAGGIAIIAALSQEILDKVYQFLSRQAPDAAVGMKNGRPQFGLITSPETSTEIIRQDVERRRDVRYADPTLNIEGYGAVEAYEGYAHIHHILAPRFVVDALGANLVRVYPYAQTPTTVGDAVNVDPAYVNAPFELSVIYLNDVYRALVPPNGPTNVSGHEFGPNDRMGTFDWLNIQHRCENPRREKGFFFAKFELSPEPLIHSNDAVAILHRRCNQLALRYCIDDGDCDSIDVTLMVQHDLTEGVDEATEYDVTLDYKLNCGPGNTVTVIWNDASTHTAVIVDDSAAPTYTIAFPHARAAGWELGPNGNSTINHIVCLDRCLEEPSFFDYWNAARPEGQGEPDEEGGITLPNGRFLSKKGAAKAAKAAKAAAAKAAKPDAEKPADPKE